MTNKGTNFFCSNSQFLFPTSNFPENIEFTKDLNHGLLDAAFKSPKLKFSLIGNRGWFFVWTNYFFALPTSITVGLIWVVYFRFKLGPFIYLSDNLF